MPCLSRKQDQHADLAPGPAIDPAYYWILIIPVPGVGKAPYIIRVGNKLYEVPFGSALMFRSDLWHGGPPPYRNSCSRIYALLTVLKKPGQTFKVNGALLSVRPPTCTHICAHVCAHHTHT